MDSAMRATLTVHHNEHDDIAAELNVPVRLMIYEQPLNRITRLTYDLSLLS